jgi:hypothetical protein
VIAGPLAAVLAAGVDPRREAAVGLTGVVVERLAFVHLLHEGRVGGQRQFDDLGQGVERVVRADDDAEDAAVGALDRRLRDVPVDERLQEPGVERHLGPLLGHLDGVAAGRDEDLPGRTVVLGQQDDLLLGQRGAGGQAEAEGQAGDGGVTEEPACSGACLTHLIPPP